MPFSGRTIEVLIIEDNLGDIVTIERSLRLASRFKFQTDPARSLKEGMEKFSKKKFELVLLDLNLPDSAGLETFRTFHEVHPNVPVVILSNLCSEEVAVHGVQMGAQDYVFKEETSQRLLGLALVYALERAHLKRQLSDIQKAEECSAVSEPWKQAVEKIQTGVFELKQRSLSPEQRNVVESIEQHTVQLARSLS